jgi:hypothetical protein
MRLIYPVRSASLLAINVRALVALSFLLVPVVQSANVSENSSVRHTNKVSATSCVDPGLHFTVRDFRGTVLDEKGKPAPTVKGDLFRLRKSKTPGQGGPFYEPAPEVFSTFVTDDQGRFQLSQLRAGMYLVVLHAPRGYEALRVNVKLDRHGVSDELVVTLQLSGSCGAWWRLASADTSR